MITKQFIEALRRIRNRPNVSDPNKTQATDLLILQKGWKHFESMRKAVKK